MNTKRAVNYRLGLGFVFVCIIGCTTPHDLIRQKVDSLDEYYASLDGKDMTWGQKQHLYLAAVATELPDYAGHILRMQQTVSTIEDKIVNKTDYSFEIELLNAQSNRLWQYVNDDANNKVIQTQNAADAMSRMGRGLLDVSRQQQQNADELNRAIIQSNHGRNNINCESWTNSDLTVSTRCY